MGQVVVVGLDIAKSVFQVHGVDRDGEVVVRRRLRRSRVLPFFAPVEPEPVGGTILSIAQSVRRMSPRRRRLLAALARQLSER